MKADWIIRIELARYFENNAEIRVRNKATKLKDTIYRGTFAQTLEEEFAKSDIARAIKIGLLTTDKIRHEAGAIRNVYLWLEKECEYQPIWYKRWFQKTLEWLRTKFLTSY